MDTNNVLVFYLIIPAIVLFVSPPVTTSAQIQPKQDHSFIIENYYKVKWGYAEEFIKLYKKNHYPLLKKALEKGDILKITAEKPRLHSTEDGRWDFKVTLVFKDVQTAFDENLTEPYKKQLYPDLKKLEEEEQHRFELLEAHWDLIIQPVDLNK